MRRPLDREDRRVDDAQAADAVHAELGVDDTAHVLGEHRARARGVESARGGRRVRECGNGGNGYNALGVDVASQPRLDVGVGGDVRTGRDLLGDERAQRRGGANTPRHLQPLAEEHHVRGVAEVRGVEDGRRKRVGRVDPEVAVAERPLVRDLDLDRIRARARAGRREQNLDLAGVGVEQRRRVLCVCRLVPVEDALVLRGNEGGCRCGDVRHDLVAKLSGIRDQLRGADIGDGAVDIGQELGRPRTWIRAVIVNPGSCFSVDPVGHTSCLNKY